MNSKIEKSHLQLLSNKTNIDNINNANVAAVLASLRTHKNVEPSENYKISILRTIKKYNKNVTKTPQSLNIKSLRSNKSDDDAFKQIILHIIKYVYTLSSSAISMLDKRSIIDTYISILLITSCNITITDIYKLKNKNLTELLSNPIVLTKKVNIIPKLYVLAQPLIQDLIKHRNQLFSDIININNVISCNPDLINKTIKELYIEYNAVIKLSNVKNLGLHKFKFKNSELIYMYINQNNNN
ncbi:VLF-1 [Penaeus monodon nudivirus]|uniref:VLF-1 n=1 Tax=Penaeus monodon nudivirus TaxID=1529056 RepID=A0A076FD59_9VIRU|nr:VLF-1 [Penaeus monodon nudivirus]AII15878.1 VLF-1 [Penaeus monodon nudivirus]